jgi:hypothetical protein
MNFQNKINKINIIVVPRSELVLKLNSVDLVRKRTIPTERPPIVGEVSVLPVQNIFQGT